MPKATKTPSVHSDAPETHSSRTPGGHGYGLRQALNKQDRTASFNRSRYKHQQDMKSAAEEQKRLIQGEQARLRADFYHRRGQVPPS